MNHTDKGYFGEQLAMAWLLKNGYWVFKNLAPQGPVDCVAIDQTTHEVILVDVKVLSVNTLNQNGKIKKFRNISGKRPDFKKAFVKLAEGNTIDTTVEVK